MSEVVKGLHGRERATYPATMDQDGPTVTYYTSDERAPAWQIAVYSPRTDLNEEEVKSGKWDPTMLHLILGDSGYHDIPKDLVQVALARADQADVLRETARVFDETGAEDEIYELLETYLELIDPDDLLPEVEEMLRS